MKETTFKVGQKVRCITNGGKDYQRMHSRQNRIVIGKTYTIKHVDETLGEVRLKNKPVWWMAKRFVAV